MDVYDALRQRKSTRAFLDKPVPREKIERILDGARHAPSGTNTQPWQVAVVTGDMRHKLAKAMETAFREGDKGELAYNYYPVDWIEPFKSRRVDCGMQLYSALGIERSDKERRRDQWAANYRSFDAPVTLFFFLHRIMETGSFMDYGMFIQSAMLMAEEEGLASCPQAALGEYPDLVRRELGYSDDYLLVCGMALGYEDAKAAVNQYRTPREPVEAFTRFYS